MEVYNKNAEQTILAIDIGSINIRAIIASCKDGAPHVIGVGFSKSQGIKKGKITTISEVSSAIKEAVSDARRVAGSSVDKAIISISGAYVNSTDSSGFIHIQNSEITLKEINRAIQTAIHKASIPNEYKAIHVLPYNFKLDDQDFIDDPMGMVGRNLEVSVRIITAPKDSISNLKKVIKNAGLEVENIVLGSYASAIATLSADEKNLGVVCVDMGGSTSDLMVHVGNSLRYNDFLAVGSNHITTDLMALMLCSNVVAEQVKVKYANFSLPIEEDRFIEVPTLDKDEKTRVTLSAMHEAVHFRLDDTFHRLDKKLEHSGLKSQLGGGVVLTGGMVQLEGIKDIAASIFNLPVRIAKPIELDGAVADLKNPECATVVGLVLYAAGHHTNYEIDSEDNIRCVNEQASSSDDGGLFAKPLVGTQNTPVNSIPKNATDIKQDLSNIIEVRKKPENSEGVVKRLWHRLTQIF